MSRKEEALMAEGTIQLDLNRVQRSHLFAHTLVYLFSVPLHPTLVRDKAMIETIQEVNYRLHQCCLDERESVPFVLTFQEAHSIRAVLERLKPLYEQWPDAPMTPVAVEHLARCLRLFHEGEPSGDLPTESRERR